MKRFASILMGVLVAKFAGVAAAGPLPSAFSFQGRLSTEGVPVNGTADFEFTLWDADVGGSMLGSLNAIDDVSIVEGLFTVQLDFGMNPFNGQAVWLEIATRSPAGGGAFQTLSPRQAILPAPYAIHALDTANGHALDAVDGNPVNVVFVDSAGDVGIGTTNPLRKFHFQTENLGIGDEDLLPGDEFIVEQDDARIALVSSSAGMTGSLLILREMVSAAVVDEWRLRRLTSPNGSDFILSFTQALGASFDALTLTPTGHLTAAGVVESTSGGFRFPDGTTQTTAASGGGPHNTLDQAYDQGDTGAGRVITADSGAVEIAGPDGLVVAGPMQVDGSTFHVSSGNNRVGIGTTTPAALLDVAGALKVDGSTFNVNPTSNRVGIGTTTPTVPLDVAGDVNVDGTVEISEGVYLTNPGISTIESERNTGIQIDNGTNKVHLLSDNSRILTADSVGNVGIGTETPGARLEINGDVRVSDSNEQPTFEIEAEGGTGGSELHMYSLSGSETITLDSEFAAGSILWMKDRFGDDAIVLDARSSGADVRFYNQHGRQTVVIEADDGADDGAVLQLYADTGTTTTATLELHGDFDGAGTSRIITDVLQINGADLSEQFDVSSTIAIEPGMVVSIDPANPGKLRIATEAYDKKVAGIISGAGGVRTGLVMGQEGTLAHGEHAVALTGRVWCCVDADLGAVEPGDQLTTSSTPGHAMIARDRDRAHGAVIGKAMTGLERGRGMVLVLVQPQ